MISGVGWPLRCMPRIEADDALPLERVASAAYKGGDGAELGVGDEVGVFGWMTKEASPTESTSPKMDVVLHF